MEVTYKIFVWLYQILYQVCVFIILRRVVVVGAGYIAVELAGIFGSLGAKTSILIRYDQVSDT